MNWKLQSNSGRSLAIWTVNYESPAHFSCDFEFQSDLVGPTETAALLRFTGLILAKSTLFEFVENAEQWLRQPLSTAASNPFERTLDAGGSFDNYLRLRFGDNPALIMGQNNAATFDYCIAGVSGNFGYVVDQTCVREFVEGISSVLGAEQA